MSHSINSKQQDILNSQLNAETDNNSNSSKLIEREHMTGTPFWITGNEELGYRGVMGKWAITEIYKTKLEVVNHIDQNEWEIILKLAGIVAQDLIEQNDIVRYGKKK